MLHIIFIMIVMNNIKKKFEYNVFFWLICMCAVH